MGLYSSLYYGWGEDMAMVWEQSSFFVLRTFLPNWVMSTTRFRTLSYQTPSVSVLLLKKKSPWFLSQSYNSWLTQEPSGWHGYVTKKLGLNSSLFRQPVTPCSALYVWCFLQSSLENAINCRQFETSSLSKLLLVLWGQIIAQLVTLLPPQLSAFSTWSIFFNDLKCF